ncbi:MAG: zinc ribbon domain-containing protein, partial [Myxococcales bacterium]|nr:zinc ribbon domain-containing protein [Myxococcales bacterium]
MPTYEYECEACGKGFEIEQRITEDRLKKCPKCGKLKLKRLVGTGNFILKGGGW